MVKKNAVVKAGDRYKTENAPQRKKNLGVASSTKQKSFATYQSSLSLPNFRATRS